MKKFNKKSLVLLVCVTMLLTFAVSGTVAYLVADTDPVVNEFTPTSVEITVTDKVNNYAKEKPTITNNSTIPVYIRVAVVAYWKDDAGNIVAPWNVYGDLGVNETNWDGPVDGVYYYKDRVASGASVELFTKYEQPEPPVTGAHLEMDIIAQAIQADGWPEGVDTAQKAFAQAASTTK